MINIKRQSGFSLIELIAVITISTIILIAVLQLYKQSVGFTINLRQRTAQETRINFCLDKMTKDIIDSVSSQGRLEILPPKGTKTLGGITINQSSANQNAARELSWVAAEDQNGTYTLYRKDFSKLDQDNTDVYYPICDGIADFDIRLLNENGLEDPNSAPAVIELVVDSYFNNNSEQTFSNYRTFCLRRNEILNLPDLNKILAEEAEIIEKSKRRPRLGSGKTETPTK